MKEKLKIIKINFKKYKWWILFGFLFLPIISLVIFLLLGLTIDFIENSSITNNPWLWIINGASAIKTWPIILIILGFYLYWVFHLLRLKVEKEAMTKETQRDDYGKAQWMDNSNFEVNYPGSTYNQVHDSYGIVVASKEINPNLIVTNLCLDSHALVLGGTGSGKTQNLVIPTIQSNAYSSVKPSMVITDPKGELYATQSILLKKQGYAIKVLNLRDTSLSMKWNPLTIIYQTWIKSHNLWLEKKEYQDINILKQTEINCFSHNKLNCEICINSIEDDHFWIYQNKFYFDNNVLDRLIKKQKITLNSKMHSDLKDLCNTLYPITDIKNDFWPKNSAKLVKAVIIGMLEDLEEYLRQSEVLSLAEEQKLIKAYLPIEKFNLATVACIISEYETMKKWFKEHPENSVAKMAANNILTSSLGQLSGILSTATTGVEIFEEPGIQAITCGNDFDLQSIDNKPTAVFIIIPDERTEHHIFVSLFIAQLYKALIEKSNTNSNKKLNRPCYFLLDEFGNIPKISNMSNIITVARSRKIFFLLILQDMKQLEEKYGRETSHIIFSNCLLHIFLQTMNLETAKNYAEMIGKSTVLRISTSGKNQDRTISESLESKDLILANELIQLPPNEAIIFYSKSQPAKTKLIPWYKVKNQIIGQISENINHQIYNFYQDFYFDISKGIFKPQNKEEKPVINSKQIHQELLIYKEQLALYKKMKDLTVTEESYKTMLEFQIYQLTNQLQGEAKYV